MPYPSRKLSFWQKTRIAAAALSHKRTPLSAKAFIVGGLFYGILPIDFIPDILPLLGLTDDAGVVLIAILAFLHLTKSIRRELEYYDTHT